MASIPVGQSQPLQQVTSNGFPADVKQRSQSVPLANGVDGQQTLQPLPAGWFQMKDPEGRALYVNPATGQSSWQRPGPPPLPEGWQKIQTPEGKDMYIHLATGAVSYDRPGIPQTAPQPASNPVQSTKVNRVVVQRAKTDSKSVVSNTAVVRAPVRKAIPRSMTAPVSGTAALNFNVDVAGVTMQAVGNIPGMQQVQMVHQLSENNNVKVLSKKLASDVAQTSITAASLATRQAKTMGKVLVSPQKLKKFSKKVVVQTGAISVKAGRACKVVMNEMVDTADGKGKYAQKKQHKYVAFNGEASLNAAVVGVADQQMVPSPQSAMQIATLSKPEATVQTHVKLNANIGVPTRMPTRKPVARPSSVAQISYQAHPSGETIRQTGPSFAGNQNGTQPFFYANDPTTTTGLIATNVETAPSTISPGSPVGPPPYQQVVQSETTMYQCAQAHAQSQPGPEPTQTIHEAAKPETTAENQPSAIVVQATYSTGHTQSRSNSTHSPSQGHGNSHHSSHKPSHHHKHTTHHPSHVHLPHGHNEPVYIDPESQPTGSQQFVDPSQSTTGDQVPYVDSGDVTVTEEEIVYVDEDGNVISEDMLTYVDENTGEVYMYEEEEVAEAEAEEEEDDANDAECDFEEEADEDIGGGDFDF